MSDTRQHIHELIDLLPSDRLTAVSGLLEMIVNPIEDELVGVEETQAVARSKEWFKQNDGIPFERVAAELGFTVEEIRNAAKDPAA